jgi:MFS family permease
MYPLESHTLLRLRRVRWSSIPPNVVFLGLTSMLTDISSEMVAAILPIYFMFALQLTPLQFGFIDGLYQGAAALARLACGLLADRWQRRREVAAAGYGLSALCKLGLLAAGNAWGAVSATIALDRIGKGMRTGPRDALISLSTTPSRLGLAFGVHRAFDTAGALLGPIVAFIILARMPHGYDVVFVSSFFIAIIGLAILLMFVRNVRQDAADGPVARPSLKDALNLLRSPPMRRLLACGTALGLVTIADSFFYLTLQQRTGMAASNFPLLYVATAMTYLLLAIPVGRLADRIGRGRVFVLGHVMLLCAAALLWSAGASAVWGLVSLSLLGAYYACTDGVLVAAASRLVPERLRASGLALVTTATGLARLVASILFGIVWNTWGLETALVVFASAMAVMLLVTARTLFKVE